MKLGARLVILEDACSRVAAEHSTSRSVRHRYLLDVSQIEQAFTQWRQVDAGDVEEFSTMALDVPISRVVG